MLSCKKKTYLSDFEPLGGQSSSSYGDPAGRIPTFGRPVLTLGPWLQQPIRASGRDCEIYVDENVHEWIFSGKVLVEFGSI